MELVSYKNEAIGNKVHISKMLFLKLNNLQKWNLISKLDFRVPGDDKPGSLFEVLSFFEWGFFPDSERMVPNLPSQQPCLNFFLWRIDFYSEPVDNLKALLK
ncbi:MAG: hypothetical protein A2Y79_08245 [Deltaproteobacteria bacterium RBG_13_43_22]|nr:MAG: hypothetical protein A2Y79_08245 [Deltaproteobacteria bacterium RBG_13_43_22]